MDISLLQAVLIGIFAYLGSLSVPWFFGLSGGWYTLSRPLISGFVIGIILGDVTTGILVGVGVQVVYIALVTPGGQMPQDLNSAAYIGVGLGIIAVSSGANVAAAVTIATAVGAVGTIFHNFMMVTNSFWNHRLLKRINDLDYNAIALNHTIFPQLVQFLYRFIPTFAVLYFGQGIATEIISSFPPESYTMRIFTALGGMLPAVGVAILLRQVVKKDIELLRYLFGFTLVAVLGMNMIALAIIAAFIATMYVQLSAGKSTNASQVTKDEDEEL